MTARPTLKDIARELGYSKNAISLGLRDSPELPVETRQKIQRAAERMGYRANPVVSHLMAQLRAGRTRGLQAKLAMINANHDPQAFKDHPTIPTYVRGCETRAAKLGYSFDRFWLHDKKASAERWRQIFLTRGIKGIVIVGLMDTNHLPPSFELVWNSFPCVVTGVRTREPALAFCSTDHHALTLQAFERALALGYKRPGLVIDDVIDALVERRFSAGYFTAQRQIPRTEHIPAYNDQAGESDRESFGQWRKKYKPDVILTLYNHVLKWLAADGISVPKQMGVIQLEWRSSQPQIAGMNQHNDVAGEAAVDLLVSQIHHNETGVQDFPRATLIGASWMDGPSVRSMA